MYVLYSFSNMAEHLYQGFHPKPFEFLSYRVRSVLTSTHLGRNNSHLIGQNKKSKPGSNFYLCPCPSRILVSSTLDHSYRTFVDIEQELCNTKHNGIPNVQK